MKSKNDFTGCPASSCLRLNKALTLFEVGRDSMSSKLLRGTFILTFGTILSKVLGLFYVIPFYQIVGSSGTAQVGS